MRIGVDVGGTHTDAVLVDGRQLLAAHKAPTTEDIASGVVSAVTEILAQSSVSASDIKLVTLGTTQFTNAVVERKLLARVGALRIGAQSSSALPIGAKWPEDLKTQVLSTTVMIDGGHEYDGTPIVEVEPGALDEGIQKLAAEAVEAVAITSVFSTSNPQAEMHAAKQVLAAMPGVKIAQSHKIGQIGLYQRENATLLNASLLKLADQVVEAFETAFSDLALTCPLFISQNDGTLMSADFARQYPVFTFSSGPTNSMRGAAFLSDRTDAMVIDVGGTTSDVGMLIGGFPRPSGSAVTIGGVLTNFRMPDVLAVGIGGGSIISEDGTAVGPQSVGRALPERALVFGGDTLTASDVAIAMGRTKFGDYERVKALPKDVASNAAKTIQFKLADTVDKMKTNAGDLPLIVVGGGGFLVPDGLPGISETLRPENAGVANAIGAAFAQVSGEADVIYTSTRRSRDDAMSEAVAAAKAKAIQAGAIEESIELAEVDETPMSYMAEPGAVIHVKAIGDADISRFTASAS
ncbi:MAG: hydantoinase/oxoprolinase family protein [Pseudomonadota bacterium]